MKFRCSLNQRLVKFDFKIDRHPVNVTPFFDLIDVANVKEKPPIKKGEFLSSPLNFRFTPRYEQCIKNIAGYIRFSINLWLILIGRVNQASVVLVFSESVQKVANHSASLY